MRKYKITILDSFFGKFTGEFVNQDQQNAETEAKEFYAHEFGTNPQDIKIVSSTEITSTT